MRRLRRRRSQGIQVWAERLRALSMVLCIGVICLEVINPQGIAEAQLSITRLWQGASWVPSVAQTVAPIPLSQRGGQVVLNGRSLATAWSQRQERIGIADMGLVQSLGLNLLNTADAAQQPVQWFTSQATNPLVLPTWLTEQYRFLDISGLAEQFGWQVETRGAVLHISTPPAQVSSIRQGRQSWGDRIVIDLDQPTPCQLSEQDGDAIVTLDAQATPALVRAFKGAAGNRLTALKVEAAGRQTRLRLRFSSSARPLISTLSNPNRILIDIRPDALVARDIQWAPGLRWRQQLVTVGSAQFPVVSLEADLHQPGLTLKPILSNPSTVVGTAPLLTTAQQNQAAAAINGGFFNRNNRLPLGAIRRKGQWVSGPILNRGAIAWTDDGDIALSRLSLQETITTSTGKQWAIPYLNSGYVAAGVSRYTRDWGSSYTAVTDRETVVTVQNEQVSSLRRVATAGRATVPIPADGYLLVIRANNEAVSALPPGTTVQVTTATRPTELDRYTEITGAGPLLVQNRQIVLNARSEQFSPAFIQEAASRSAIGKMADGRLLLVAVHNRLNGSGPTLAEIAQIMQRLGASDALNLDGGSSTTLYLGGQLLDRTASSAARVNNGIGIFIQPQ